MSDETSKQTKEQQEREKPQLQLLPLRFVEAVADRLALGARQRGEWNWRTGPKLSLGVYIGKALRHLYAAADGEWEDMEGGSHLAAAAADIAVVLDAAACGQLKWDDASEAELDAKIYGEEPTPMPTPTPMPMPMLIPQLLTEYIVWHNADTYLWSAEEAPMHGPLKPPTLGFAWMFVSMEKAIGPNEAVKASQAKHPGLCVDGSGRVEGVI